MAATTREYFRRRRGKRQAASGTAAYLRAVPASRRYVGRATVSRPAAAVAVFTNSPSAARTRRRASKIPQILPPSHFVFVAAPAFGRPPYLVNNRLANRESRIASAEQPHPLRPSPPVANPATTAETRPTRFADHRAGVCRPAGSPLPLPLPPRSCEPRTNDSAPPLHPSLVASLVDFIAAGTCRHATFVNSLP